MRRTGSALGALLFLSTATAASAAPEVQAEVDRSEVGLLDTFILTVHATNAPRGSAVQLPRYEGAEVLSTNRGESSFIQLGSGGPVIRQELTVTVILHPTRVGKLTLPPVELRTPDGVVKSNALSITVRNGHLGGPSTAGQQRPNMMPGFPPGFPDLEDPFAALREREREAAGPHGENDLFLRSEVDKKEVYVGEQVTLSVWIYSRVDLSQVSNEKFPKLDGFWTEDIESPTSIVNEPRTVNGVPYRAALLKRKALFPMRAGTRELEPAEMDATTGFLFAGRREHRVGNPLTLKVKPLPQGAPPGFVPANVGSFQLSAELSAASAELGSPVTLRVVLQGQGNMKEVVLPRAVAPAALKLYEPTSQERISAVHERIEGKRSQEYLVMAQQTGTFEIPPLSFSYFDPESHRYETVRTQPLSLTVTPGEAGALRAASPSGGVPDAVRNVLPAGALRPLRLEARFQTQTPVWRRPVFVAAALAPPAAFMLLSLVGVVRARRARHDPVSEQRRGTRAARGRLAAAARLRASGTDGAFSEEVERAVTAFLEARLGAGLSGLTRDALRHRLTQAGAPAALVEGAARVLDTCDAVRFAPGAVRLDRQALLAEAEQVLEGWG
jgi:BatD DUF11 like domain